MTQSDPNGIDQHAPGAKLDNGKMRPWLVLSAFSQALGLVTEIGTFGAEKYSDNGWLNVPEGEKRYAEALMRHVMAHWGGEVNDPESGLPHLAHAAWNILALIELRERDGGFPLNDKRSHNFATKGNIE